MRIYCQLMVHMLWWQRVQNFIQVDLINSGITGGMHIEIRQQHEEYKYVDLPTVMSQPPKNSPLM